MQRRKFLLNLCISLAVDPKLRKDRTVRRALEERTEHELKWTASRLVIWHLVEVAEEPHADEWDGEAGRVPSWAIQPELWHAEKSLIEKKERRKQIDKNSFSSWEISLYWKGVAYLDEGWESAENDIEPWMSWTEKCKDKEEKAHGKKSVEIFLERLPMPETFHKGLRLSAI